MRIPGRKAVRDALRWGRSRTGWRGVILGYHRVADDAWDPFDLAVETTSFAGQLEVLRERAHPMRLDELANALADGRRPPERAVAVTFDDGYVNNLEVAEPLLRRFDVPATLFAISGAPGEEPWWEELARLLRPDREAAVATARELMDLPAARIRGRLDELRQRAGGRLPAGPAHRLMTTEQLKRLAADGTFEIASHTVSHPVLTTQPLDRQREEIVESRRALQQAIGVEVRGFSYPNGARAAGTVGLVREAGYRYACSSERDVVRRSTDLLDLPRFWLPPMDRRRFARWLDRWLG